MVWHRMQSRCPSLHPSKASIRSLSTLSLFLGLASLSALAPISPLSLISSQGLAAEPSPIRKSLARIGNTSQDPNYRQPWLPGATMGSSGTGWVVSKDRILTNAHVVSNARFLTLEKENDPKKYIATVEHIAHDCDLAILKVLHFENRQIAVVGNVFN
ncbi:MAG: trypsin-like peptidase domain-containing protein, partial [Verrucomicrobiota bacterium]